ncbi:sialin-like isoform X2 [Cylas formicarius]|uniref:sialin-like isoform X2 n=1 Tax=Cylas formicarius TaxID=197179 RepID=UPI0029589EFD|nr:sialin-like isoform X2 [Cylas formicarius]
MEKGNEIKVSKHCCSARDVLWYLVFVGFAVNYMIRINLNIAIVAMVQPRPKDNVSISSECIIDAPTSSLLLNKSDTGSTIFNTSDHEPLTNQSAVVRAGNFSENKDAKFDWNEKVQGYVLGSFFWLHWVTQVPGGILAGKYGTKLVFGLSNFGGVVLCFAIPYCAWLGHTSLILLRLVQGLICGFAWPSMHNLTARWIPPNERSKFVTAYLGSSVGTALTYPVCGFIIDRWGWEYVFYVSSFFGTVWFVAWWMLVYDSPGQHPRISKNERDYILASLGESVAKTQSSVPWSNIFKSRTVWMNILTQFGGLWGLFTLMTHAPTYFKFIHGWNIKATGLLSGMPHMFRMLWAYAFSLIGDYLLRTNKMNRTNVRKLATGFCCVGQGVFMLGLAYSGCNSLAAIIFLTLAVAVHGSVSTGPLASVVDISPNYASVILGLMNTSAAIVGFITPALVGYLTFQNQTAHQWQRVFWVATFFLVVSGLGFALFAKSELKSWNTPLKNTGPPETELMIIHAKTEAKDEGKATNVRAF